MITLFFYTGKAFGTRYTWVNEAIPSVSDVLYLTLPLRIMLMMEEQINYMNFPILEIYVYTAVS